MERRTTLVTLIFGAALARLLPHPWNMTPVAAMALFAGVRMERGLFALLVPFAAMLVSDALLGFHASMGFVYGALAITVLLGRVVRQKESFFTVAGAAVASSLVFFFVTNAGHWLVTNMYPKTLAGFGTCLVAGLPFYRGTLVGDLLFTGALFGSFQALVRLFPRLSSQTAS